MSEELGIVCVVCRNSNKKSIYAIGRCDHSVCYECSTRMRVLCKQNECPICRQQSNEVVFTRFKHKKFEDFDLNKCLYKNDFGIHFEDEESLESYGKLLEHPCRKCRNRQPFKTVHDLVTHLRKEHELHLCDLCLANLKVFTNERKYYTRKELVRHRKTGDPDETSHRGHPICTFCDQRYVDEDDLHLHLRKEHFYCHFCDPSGLNHFYADYGALRDHFLSDHYLCKECDCQEEKFTNAFNSEIDLQVHIAQMHSQNMSKSDLKKAKTLSLDLFIRQRSGQPLDNGQQTKRQMKREQRRQTHKPADEMDSELLTADDFLAANASAAPPPVQPPRPEDFPSLSGPPNETNILETKTSDDNEVKEEKKGNKKSNSYSLYLSKNPKLNTTNFEEFPALPGSKSPQINASNSLTYNKLTKQKPMNSRAQTSGAQKSVNLIDSSIIPKPQTKQKQNSNKPLVNNKEEFPSLPVTKKKSSRNSGQSSSPVNGNNDRKKGQTIEWSNSSQTENKSPKNITNGNICETKPISFDSIAFEEFPVLETTKKKVSNSQTPPKPPATKPVNNVFIRQKVSNPPPGLPAIDKSCSGGLSLSSVAQQVISTSSADQSLNGLDSDINEYIIPIDFNERNQKLVKEVENVLSDRSKFLLFKEASKQFRQTVITGEQYYQKCIELFGRKQFSAVFSELLVLLPDIRKQNELLKSQQIDIRNTKGAIPKGSKLFNDFNCNEFIICLKCKQVLINKDQSHHMSVH